MTDKILTKEEIRDFVIADVFDNSPEAANALMFCQNNAQLAQCISKIAMECMESYASQFREGQSGMRFKKPTDEQVINFAIMVNEGGLDPGKLTDMVALSQIIIDRLYENGDIMIPSKIENDEREELTEDKIAESVYNALDKPESREPFEKWLDESPCAVPSEEWIRVQDGVPPIGEHFQPVPQSKQP